MKVSPYLIFDGQCADAFRLYERVLGGRIETMMTHAESPMADQVGPESRDRIMHANLVAGDVVLMGSDAPLGQSQQPGNIHVSLHVEDAAEGERIFNALAENGKVTMGFEKTFWSPGFGMLVDRFGIPWMVNVEQPVEQGSQPRRAQDAGVA